LREVLGARALREPKKAFGARALREPEESLKVLKPEESLERGARALREP
jgi:hypothetical protein